jgi:PAS domain S-box-containing protein
MIYVLIIIISSLIAFLAYRYEKLILKNKELLENYNKELKSELKKQTADLVKQKTLLEDSEFRWKFAVDGSGDGLWDWNTQTNEVYFSPRWKKMLGFEDNEIKNSLEEWEKRVHPNDLEQVYKDLKEHMEGKVENYQNEHRVLCKDGSYKWVLDRGIIVKKDENGNPLRLIGTHTDIDERRKNQEELIKSNIKFNSIYNYSLDAIILLDTETGKFSDVNLRTIELYGYTKEELLDLKIIDIEASHDEEKIRITQENILKRGWDQFESKHKLKNGIIIDVNVNAVAINILNKNYLYATFRDITKEKQLEQKVISERNFISTIIDNANSVIAVIDNKGRMFRVNKYAQEFIGYTQEEIASEPYFWSRFLHENQKDRVLDIIKEANKGQITKSFKNSWISKNKEERVFEWSNTLVKNTDGTMNYLVTIGIDVTQKENILKLILDKKVEFEAIFKYAQDGIVITNLEGDFLKFNDSFKNFLGYKEDELLLKNDNNITSEKYKKINKKAIEKTIASGHVENYEKEYITKNNKKITVHISISLLPNKQSLLFIIKDTSSIKLLEEQSKLASMGEMIGNIAHQWRQPLSIITTTASGLKLESELNMEISKEQISQYSDLVLQQATYLSDTIDNFRDFLKDDKNHRITKIDKIINYTLDLVNATMKNNDIQLIKEIEDNLFINGSINELSEAFINILNNSKDILKEKVSNKVDRFIFIHAYKKNSSEIIITFKDTGGGVPDNIINRVFEPYFTSKHKSIGTGLGLSIADKIIRERHKGTISVKNEIYNYKSKSYKSACFIITLPLENNL